MKCKNCGHDIVLVPTEEGKSFWFHQSELLFKEDYKNMKLESKSWGNSKRYCANQEGIESCVEINDIEIRHIPYCGCSKPEPQEKKVSGVLEK